MYGEFATSKPGVSTGSASGGSESWKTRCFNRVLPPAGQNPGKWSVSTGFYLRRVRILKNDLFLMYPRHPIRFHGIQRYLVPLMVLYLVGYMLP